MMSLVQICYNRTPVTSLQLHFILMSQVAMLATINSLQADELYSVLPRSAVFTRNWDTFILCVKADPPKLGTRFYTPPPSPWTRLGRF